MSLRIAVLAAVAMVLSACGGTSWPAPAGYSEHEIEVAVIGTCQKSVKDGLKDSGSAKFGGDWKAWIVTHHDKPPRVTNYHPEYGDKLYSAGGTVNATNGFGGYVGDQAYGCDASVTTSGDVHAIAYSLNDILNPPTAASTTPRHPGRVVVLRPSRGRQWRLPRSRLARIWHGAPILTRKCALTCTDAGARYWD